LIKVVVVDDEAPARRELRRLLEATERVSVAGEAKDVATARGLAARTRPDVVFLDVQLGRESGFVLLPELDEWTAVVFVTAYDRYAIHAFEENALDYLLKPVDPVRLSRSLDRVEAFLRARHAPPEPVSPIPFTTRQWVFLHEGERAEFVRLDSISRIDSERGGSTVRTADGVGIWTARSLEEWLLRLPAADFRRVHRSTIVNLGRVERVEPWSNYTFRLHLRGDRDPIAMSRRYAARLRDELG
jgi:two-component system, LytTR family, response regulator